MRYVELSNIESKKLGDIKTAGNHWVVIRGYVNHCHYHSTEICTVDNKNKTFQVIDKKISHSTSCACGKYRNYLNMHGYKEVKWKTIALN